MLRGLLAIIYKEFLQVRRDPGTRIVFLIPCIQTIIFGFAINMDVQHLPTAVYDMDRSVESRELIAQFGNTGTFDIVTYVDSRDALQREVTAGRAKVAVLVPQDYSARVLANEPARVQVLIDGSDSTVANNAMLSAQSIGQARSLRSAGFRERALPVEIRTHTLYNPNLESSRFYVPGLVGTILQLVTVTLTAFAIVRERERGTLEQLSVTPVSRYALVIGKLVPYALIGFIQTILVLALMRFVFGVEVEGSRILLFLLSSLFLVPALALGILISTFARNQGEALQLSMLIMLPSILLSGFAFPRETMPLPIYCIGALMPLTYYLQILRGIILRGAEFAMLWQQTAALAAFAVGLVTLSALRFKKRIH